MKKRKINRIFLFALMILISGYLISEFFFPNFIGENESDLFDFVPIKIRLIFLIPVFFLFLYLRNKYKIIYSGFEINWMLFKIIGSFILLSFLSFLISSLFLLTSFSFANYCNIHKSVVLSGNIYKKEIHKVKKRPNEHIIYFNDSLKLKTIVSTEKYDRYYIGDVVKLRVVKGRFHGFYLVQDLLDFD